MERNEIVPAIVKRFESQGGLAYEKEVGCRYRTADNRACAVGALIPDNLYIPEIEGREVAVVTNTRVVNRPEFRFFRSIIAEAGLLDIHTVDILTQLQAMHDDCARDHARNSAIATRLIPLLHSKPSRWGFARFTGCLWVGISR